MSTPTTAPPERDPDDVAPADSYHRADPVWVYRNGWHAGVIEAASPRAVTVTYRPGSHRGTGVDTFTAPYVTPRADEDPTLDHRNERGLAERGAAGQGWAQRGPAQRGPAQPGPAQPGQHG